MNNVVCIAQLRGGYIEGNKTKYISPIFFFTHDLKTKDEINVQQVPSSDNLADMLTKALPTSIFEKLRNKIGMSHLLDIRGSKYGLHSFFLNQGFIPLIFLIRFLMRQQIMHITIVFLPLLFFLLYGHPRGSNVKWMSKLIWHVL